MAAKNQNPNNGHVPSFAEVRSTPDPTKFKIPHLSDNQLYKLINAGVQAYPEPSHTDAIDLKNIWGEANGATEIDRVNAAKKIIFHMVGDTGSTGGPKHQNEVSDKLVLDFDEQDKPSFLFHLGDVVYSFGEGKYYYDQFYEPYRDYPAPIVAIPGNHDGMTYKGDLDLDGKPAKSLSAFLRNFVAETPATTEEAGGLVRTAMTQPGVYFCIDAPFVTIIGLYSNTLEDPGVISTQGNKIKGLNDNQLAFLDKHLSRLKALGDKSLAVIIAVHHPPYAYSDSGHAGSPLMLDDIDGVCSKVGFWPHAIISGHAHNYQRYTRTKDNRDTPFIICGNSGHNAQLLSKTRTVRTPTKVSEEVIFENYDDKNYGYLRLICDGKTLRVEYHDNDPDQKSESDAVTVNLEDYTMVAN
jgi:predicted phosphodiesterase